MVLRPGLSPAAWFQVGPGQRTPPLKAALNYLLVTVLIIALFWLSLAGAGVRLDFSFVPEYRVRLLEGFWLLSVIAVIEITQTIREITATNYNFFGGYIFLGVLYLCLTLPLMFVSSHFERKFDYAH